MMRYLRIAHSRQSLMQSSDFKLGYFVFMFSHQIASRTPNPILQQLRMSNQLHRSYIFPSSILTNILLVHNETTYELNIGRIFSILKDHV